MLNKNNFKIKKNRVCFFFFSLKEKKKKKENKLVPKKTNKKKSGKIVAIYHLVKDKKFKIPWVLRICLHIL